MALQYFLYDTTYGNTIVDRSNTSFAPSPPYGQIYIDYFIPETQPLYLYANSGGTGGTIIINSQVNIDNYLGATEQPPTPDGNVTYGEFTGSTTALSASTAALETNKVNISGDTMSGSLFFGTQTTPTTRFARIGKTVGYSGLDIQGLAGLSLNTPYWINPQWSGYTGAYLTLGTNGLITLTTPPTGATSWQVTGGTNNIVANVPEDLGFVVVPTQTVFSGTIEWNIDFTNSENQEAHVSLQGVLDNVVYPDKINYIVAKNETSKLFGSIPISVSIPSGSTLDIRITSDRNGIVNRSLLRISKSGGGSGSSTWGSITGNINSQTDLQSQFGTKLNTSIYQTYTGTTAPATYALKANAITGATNGLSKNGLNIKLGGTLTGNTDIDVANNRFTIIASGYANSPILNLANNSAYLYIDLTGGTSWSYVNVTENGACVESSTKPDYDCYGALYTCGTIGLACLVSNGSTEIVRNDIGRLMISSGGTIFNDLRISPKGIEYNGDYSATYSNRSLVDKGYVTGITSTLLPISTFNTYVGTTAPATYALKSLAITGATNLGSGNGTLYTNISGNKINLKTLSGGTNVTITCNGNYVTINSTSAGSGITWTGSTLNGVGTYASSGRICSNPNMTFNGSALSITGNINASTYVCSPIITGSTRVCSPIVCGTSCLASPIICGTTRIQSPIICGSTCVRSPLISGGTLSILTSATAPTPAINNNSTCIATTAFVTSKIGSYLPLTGGTITGNLTLAGATAYLTSCKYCLGQDLIIYPIVDNQSAIKSWWGLQLRGYSQGNLVNNPLPVGSCDSYSVVVITDTGNTPTVSTLSVVASPTQTTGVKLQTWQKSNLTTSASIDCNGGFKTIGDITGSTLYITTTPQPIATIQQPSLFWDSNTKQIEAKTLTGGSDQYFYGENTTNRTTTSTTCIKAQGLTGTTLAGRFEVTFSAEFGNATSNACTLGAFKIDNVTQGTNRLARFQVANGNLFDTFTRDVTLTAATHCFDIWYWNNAGTACVPISTIRVKRIC